MKINRAIMTVFIAIGLILTLAEGSSIMADETPVPELARWKAQMLQFGRLHGDRFVNGTYLTEDNAYYDGERVYQQIAAYTGDPYFTTIANYCEHFYRDDYVIPNNGNAQGYNNFTHGLAMDYLTTGDTQSKAAIILLATHMFGQDGLPPSATASCDLSREVAYVIAAYINAERVGEARRDRLALMFEQALGHLDQWFIAKSDPTFAPFMYALTAEALIYYWDYVDQDPRILDKLRMGADYIWDNCWLPASEAFYYRKTNPAGAAPDLNLLIAPVYSWLYLQTHDTMYRDRGDQVFAGGVRRAYLEGNVGKTFNQNYRWSFDYLKWRKQAGLAGDTNGDGRVNVKDLIFIATRFGVRQGDAAWDPRTDLNENGIIDVVDLVTCARHLGE